MKRGGTLPRKTPLTPGKPLKRTTEMPRSAKPLPITDAKPKRQRNTGPSKSVRDLVKARARYMCEICGHHIGATGGEIHHRHGRQMGGTRRPWINLPSNLLYLCSRDHEMVTNTRGNRAEYERMGWLVREGIDPRGVRVIADVGAVFLNDLGGRQGYIVPDPDTLEPLQLAAADEAQDAA